MTELRYALRQLWKTRGFTTTAVLTLAVGIGANLTVFQILYGVILRPLPFPNPYQLVRVERFYSDGALVPAYSGTKVLFMSRTSRAIDAAAAYDFVPSHVNLVQGSEAIPLRSLRVTPAFFHVFQMEPQLGQGFNPADMAPHAARVVVLSDAIWRQQFRADPDIVGRPVVLGNENYTVVGVANPKFQLDARVDVWTALRIAEGPEDHANDYNFVARLKTGITFLQAEDDLKRVLGELKNTYPALWNQDESVRVIDYHDSLVRPMRPALQMLMGAVVLVLLIVSANIASLLLVRSIARRREVGLRVALGASGWQILRQLLIENGVLCVAGGCAAILIAKFATPVLMRLTPLDLPQFTSLNLGAPGLVFAALLVSICGVLFALVPLMEVRRARINDSLGSNPNQVAVGHHPAQKVLVVGEVAVSLVLLVASALLLSSFWRLVHTSAGFDPQDVVTFKTSFSAEQAGSGAVLGRQLDELLALIQALPGVDSAAAALVLPTQAGPDLPFDVIGRPAREPGSSGDEKYLPITPSYFTALRIPLLKGRPFTWNDVHGSAPVVMVNQEFVRRYFPAENPVGQHILIGKAMGPGFEDDIREIIGVVGDTKQVGLDRPAPGVMYLPAAQVPDGMTRLDVGWLGMSWVVRAKPAQKNVASALRQIFMEHARIPLLSIETMHDVMGASVAQQRFSMLLFSTFGLLSLGLGAAGLYGVMSYSVARRTREIGVRLALGAQRADIVKMVLREATLLVGCGLTAGIVTSVAAAQMLRSLLFGVGPQDPVALLSASGVLIMTGLLSAWWPASRAASTEPMEALRIE